MVENTHNGKSTVGADVSAVRRAEFARWKVLTIKEEMGELERQIQMLHSQIEKRQIWKRTWKNRLKESIKDQSQGELRELTSQIQNCFPQEIRDIIYSKYLSCSEVDYVQEALHLLDNVGAGHNKSHRTIDEEFVLLDSRYASKEVTYELTIILLRRYRCDFTMKQFKEKPTVLSMATFLTKDFFKIGLEAGQCVRRIRIEIDGFLIRDEYQQLKRNLNGLFACRGNTSLTISILVLPAARIMEVIEVLKIISPIQAQLVASGVRFRIRYYRGFHNKCSGDGGRERVFNLPCGCDCLDLGDILTLPHAEWQTDIVERIGFENLYRKERFWHENEQRRREAKIKQRKIRRTWNIWADDLLIEDEGLTMRHYSGADFWEIDVDGWLEKEKVYIEWLKETIGFH